MVVCVESRKRLQGTRQSWKHSRKRKVTLVLFCQSEMSVDHTGTAPGPANIPFGNHRGAIPGDVLPPSLRSLPYIYTEHHYFKSHTHTLQYCNENGYGPIVYTRLFHDHSSCIKRIVRYFGIPFEDMIDINYNIRLPTSAAITSIN